MVTAGVPYPWKHMHLRTHRAVKTQEQWYARGHTAHLNAHAAMSATNATTHFYAKAVVDHFGAWVPSHTYWKQRYYIDQTYWGGTVSGPSACSEWPISK